jgi:hydroxymethylglutaryl-CoA reductase (NADPH)
MTLRNLSPADRQKTLENDLDLDLSALPVIEQAEDRNCENMFGAVPIPIGYAGPLPVQFISGETSEVHLPLATTEAALIASVNRGAKAIRDSGSVFVESVYHGITRSMAFRIKNYELRIMNYEAEILFKKHEWIAVGEATSNHLKIIKYEIDIDSDYLFLTIYADTDEAMGMNMVTIAAQKIGEWIEKNLELEFVTVAGNVDSDKKPSKRTRERGRGYEVTASASISSEVIIDVLKSDPEAMLEVANAKLNAGSNIAGALGSNLHAANIIAALYLATGQDAAHVVEGSLADTKVSLGNPLSHGERVGERGSKNFHISVHLPAILVGTLGGGTHLPAQKQCLQMLLKSNVSSLKSSQQLAEIIAAATLAGELSLLSAQASHHLAQSHKQLARCGSTNSL